MMFAPDFTPVFLVFWAMLSIPMLLAALFVLLAACSGVEASVRLRWLRYLVAVVFSTISGWLVLAAILLVGLASFGLLELVLDSPTQVLAALCLFMTAAALAALVAYRTGRRIGVALRNRDEFDP